METFYKQALLVGRQVISLIALALNLDENFFEKIGALDNPSAFLRLLHYPGDLRSVDEEILGASAHSDYGMITLLVTNGIPGLQLPWCNRYARKSPIVHESGKMLPL